MRSYVLKFRNKPPVSFFAFDDNEANRNAREWFCPWTLIECVVGRQHRIVAQNFEQK